MFSSNRTGPAAAMTWLSSGSHGAGCGVLWVPKTCSTSCDQVIFVDQATDLSVFSDAVEVEIDRLG